MSSLLPSASFAGQHDTFLNVQGETMPLDAIRRCNTSLSTDRAISYRIDQGFDHFKVARSAGIMKMVRADLASSGVMFSIDTETGFRDAVFITGICGQAPSDSPEIAEFLVRQEITSISLTSDRVIETTLAVLDLECEMGRAPRQKD